MRILVGGGVRQVVCDVAELTDAGLEAVVLLARLQLTARRLGGSIRVRNAGTGLHEVLWLVGLCNIVGPCAPLLLEAGRQAEEWEEPRAVEEEGDAADPIA